MKIFVPMAGLIDVAAERSRLEKQAGKVEADLSKAEAKLANPRFVDNAPAEIVAKERERETAFRRELAQIREQLGRLESLS
jgi:valyl-tRNA synthetase